MRAASLVTAALVISTLACSRDADPAARTSDATRQVAAEAAPAQPTQTAAEAASLVREDGTIFAETELMGTRVSINLWVGGGDALAASEAMTDAIHEMARIEDIASEWRATSDLTRVNEAGGAPVKVAPELIEILTRAAAISAETDGLFDVSFYGVGQLWRFEPGAEPPTKDQIAALLPSVDWRSIELDPGAGTVALRKPGMKVGLGAIAKGYAVDRASAVLRSRGFANHIVEAGGDTQVSGQKGDKPWRVGVQDPKQAAGRIGHISAKDEAVVTSGNYARFFEWEGVHYTHILDPRTGWPIPVDRSPKSVTLVASNATNADAYCTAVSVMEPAQGLAFVDAHPELEAVIIGPDDVLYVSAGLKDRFVDERE
ncbi:Thiamin biosynthesis lipoprotein ApbE [Enhygromyxa salina]|uniref:FAD:protein FMN transferase n=1 Tax=Enhygromyxa salina TaxID=215803 RepID=A0A0C1Z2U2_9BACT|nr:FAD:protein FMN transferase [Enhygromyxa salina]KIG11824.1 Thiamin biosynthesis lipoprotein ApbE [Enhygromyxa salina]